MIQVVVILSVGVAVLSVGVAVSPVGVVMGVAVGMTVSGRSQVVVRVDVVVEVRRVRRGRGEKVQVTTNQILTLMTKIWHTARYGEEKGNSVV